MGTKSGCGFACPAGEWGPALLSKGSECLTCQYRIHLMLLWTKGPSPQQCYHGYMAAGSLPWESPWQGSCLAPVYNSDPGPPAYNAWSLCGGCTGPTCLPQFGATLKDFPAPGPSLGQAEAWLQPHHSSTLPVTCPTLLLSFTADVSRPNSQEIPRTRILCF